VSARSDRPRTDPDPHELGPKGQEESKVKKHPSKGTERRRPRLAYAFALLSLIGVIGLSGVYLLTRGGGEQAYPSVATSTYSIVPRNVPSVVQESFTGAPLTWATDVDGDIGTLSFTDGKFIFSIERANTWLISRHAWLESSGVGLVQVMPRGSISSGSSYGVMCRLQSDGDGYAFALYPHDRYRILKLELGIETILAEGIFNDDALEPHELAFKCQADLLAFTVDRGPWIEVHDTTFRSGAIALFAHSGEQDDLSIGFDDFTFWYVP